MGYKGSVAKRKLRQELPTPSFKYPTRPNLLLILGLLSCLSVCTSNQLSNAAADPPPPDLDSLIKSGKMPDAAGTSKADPGAGDETNSHPASPAAYELGDELEKKLEDLESHFFGHIYRSEAAAKRIARLERFVFGTESSGTLPIRINHIAGTLSVADPDGTKREIKLHPKEIQPVAQEQPEPQSSQSQQSQQSQQSSQSSPEGQSGGNSIPSIVNSPEEHTVKTPSESAIPIATPMPTAKASPMMVAPVMQAPGSDQSSKILVLQVTKSTFATPGNPGESIKELDVAIRVHPSDAELMFERAKAWIQMDKISSALNDLSDAIMHDPNKSTYYLARAWCYKKLGNTYLAADDVKQARFVNPSLPPQIDLLQNTKEVTNGAAE